MKKKKKAGRVIKKIIRSVLLTVLVVAGLGIIGGLVWSVVTAYYHPEKLPPQPTPYVEVVETTPTPQPKAAPEETPAPINTNKDDSDGKDKKAVAVSFSSDEANRAAVTAFTNYYAKDVYGEKGKRDPSKFHSFAETTGNTEDYLIYDQQTGSWVGIDENTWHVENLQLLSADGSSRVVSLDVTKSGDIYYIKEVKVLESSDGTTPNIDTKIQCFAVRKELIEGDRQFDK